MDLREYYGFPEGSNVSLNFRPSFYDTVDSNYPCPADMSYAYSNYNGSVVKKLNTSNVTSMNYMFYASNKIDSIDVNGWDTSNVTSMNNMFYQCGIESIDLSSWDTSKVTNMDRMFYSNHNLESIGYMNCISVAKDKYPIYNYSASATIKNLGGFYMRNSWVNTQGLTNCTGLTVESLVNVLNALYDFTGNGETPNSNEGKLALGATNLAKLTDEQKAIATNKGWTLS